MYTIFEWLLALRVSGLLCQKLCIVKLVLVEGSSQIMDRSRYLKASVIIQNVASN